MDGKNNESIRVPGYAGICCICGFPVLVKESTTIIPEEEEAAKMHFHQNCLQENPNDYNVKRERKRWEKILAKRELQTNSI